MLDQVGHLHLDFSGMATVDYVIVCAYLVILVLVGLWLQKKASAGIDSRSKPTQQRRNFECLTFHFKSPIRLIASSVRE